MKSWGQDRPFPTFRTLASFYDQLLADVSAAAVEQQPAHVRCRVQPGFIIGAGHHILLPPEAPAARQRGPLSS